MPPPTGAIAYLELPRLCLCATECTKIGISPRPFNAFLGTLERRRVSRVEPVDCLHQALTEDFSQDSIRDFAFPRLGSRRARPRIRRRENRLLDREKKDKRVCTERGYSRKEMGGGTSREITNGATIGTFIIRYSKIDPRISIRRAHCTQSTVLEDVDALFQRKPI